VSLTPAKLVASAEAICAQRDAAVAAVGTSIASEGQLKRIARGRAAAEKTAFTALSKLTPTSSLEPSWAKFMDDRRVLINGWIKVSEQGLKAHHRAFSETVSAQEKMLAAAKRDHLKRCSQAD